MGSTATGQRNLPERGLHANRLRLHLGEATGNRVICQGRSEQGDPAGALTEPENLVAFSLPQVGKHFRIYLRSPIATSELRRPAWRPGNGNNEVKFQP